MITGLPMVGFGLAKIILGYRKSPSDISSIKRLTEPETLFLAYVYLISTVKVLGSFILYEK
jgi:hypothetical protein